MDEELDQIEKNDTWELVPRPKNKNVIGTKWVFRNKLNEDGHVTRNKARQVGFRKGSANNKFYIKVSQGNILLIEVYVDDIIFGSDDDRLSQKFAKDMQNEFEMSLLGELSFFLGLHIYQSNQGIFISQTKYIREILKRFGMEDCKPIITPMQTSYKLSKDDDSKSIDQRQYRSIIGSLLYVTASNPDVNRGRVYCNNNMLYIGSLDETNFDRYTG
jgi:hypothetical protein